MTTKAESKALTQRVYDEIFGQGKLELIDDLCTADYCEHVPPFTPGQPTRGPEALKALVNRVRTGNVEHSGLRLSAGTVQLPCSCNRWRPG